MPKRNPKPKTKQSRKKRKALRKVVLERRKLRPNVETLIRRRVPARGRGGRGGGGGGGARLGGTGGVGSGTGAGGSSTINVFLGETLKTQPTISITTPQQPQAQAQAQARRQPQSAGASRGRNYRVYTRPRLRSELRRGRINPVGTQPPTVPMSTSITPEIAASDKMSVDTSLARAPSPASLPVTRGFTRRSALESARPTQLEDPALLVLPPVGAPVSVPVLAPAGPSPMSEEGEAASSATMPIAQPASARQSPREGAEEEKGGETEPTPMELEDADVAPDVENADEVREQNRAAAGGRNHLRGILNKLANLMSRQTTPPEMRDKYRALRDAILNGSVTDMRDIVARMREIGNFNVTRPRPAAAPARPDMPAPSEGAAQNQQRAADAPLPGTPTAQGANVEAPAADAPAPNAEENDGAIAPVAIPPRLRMVYGAERRNAMSARDLAAPYGRRRPPRRARVLADNMQAVVPAPQHAENALVPAPQQANAIVVAENPEGQVPLPQNLAQNIAGLIGAEEPEAAERNVEDL